MKKFKIEKNEYLKKEVQGYYNATYKTMGEEDNPDYLNHLKNTYGKPDSSDNKEYAKKEELKLINAVKELKEVFEEDLPSIYEELKLDSLYISIVPRSKKESSYKDNQLLFKSTIQSVVKNLKKKAKFKKLEDATDFIIREKNTKTTHLNENTPNYKNDGENPYIGITEDTCKLNSNIKDKDILLVDDIYTKDVNIDEDAIQALLSQGANSVTFYAVGACGI